VRDPCVVCLTYKMTPDSENIKFEKPDPVEAETEQLRARLENDVLTVEMKMDFPSVDEAKKAVRGFIQSWEIDSHLTELWNQV
jgi:hypothetical protein